LTITLLTRIQDTIAAITRTVTASTGTHIEITGYRIAREVAASIAVKRRTISYQTPILTITLLTRLDDTITAKRRNNLIITERIAAITAHSIIIITILAALKDTIAADWFWERLYALARLEHATSRT